MIARVWHAWATADGGAAYERYFATALLPQLRRVEGFAGANLLRREDDGEVELVTITWFDSPEAVRRFAGEAPEQAVVSAEAQAVLTRFDRTVQHFELRQGDPPLLQ